MLSYLWVQGVNLLYFCLPLWMLFEAPNPNGWLYRYCPTYITSTDVLYIQIAVQAENSPYSDWRRFSSYTSCILCTQEPVLLVYTSPSASANDLLELKRIHLCCVTTHISNFSWNCQWIGAKNLPHNEQYLIPLIKGLHHCKQQFLHIAWNTEERYLLCSCRMWHLS